MSFWCCFLLPEYFLSNGFKFYLAKFERIWYLGTCYGQRCYLDKYYFWMENPLNSWHFFKKTCPKRERNEKKDRFSCMIKWRFGAALGESVTKVALKVSPKWHLQVTISVTLLQKWHTQVTLWILYLLQVKGRSDSFVKLVPKVSLASATLVTLSVTLWCHFHPKRHQSGTSFLKKYQKYQKNLEKLKIILNRYCKWTVNTFLAMAQHCSRLVQFSFGFHINSGLCFVCLVILAYFSIPPTAANTNTW